MRVLLVLAYSLASPITFIVSVVDTWKGQGSVLVKIIVSLTIDAFLSGIWPLTWILWAVLQATGRATPLHTVLGIV